MKYTDILIDLRKILRSINLENKKVEKKYGVSTPQIIVLNYLNEQDNYQSTSTQIKKLLNLNASTVTGIISRLVKKGLIARVPSQKDRRVVNICITMKGMDLIKSLPTVLHEKLAEKLENLSEEQQLEIKNALEILTKLMGVEDVDASPVLSTRIDLDEEKNG